MILRDFKLAILVLIVGLFILTACDFDTPKKFTGPKWSETTQVVPQDKTQAVCRAIENAGYILPYGSPAWYDFKISRSVWVLRGTDAPLLSVPDGAYHLFILVDWNVPADYTFMEVKPKTEAQLALEAKKICRIVQQEAKNQGIGPLNMTIWIWDLVGGWQLEYGQSTISQFEFYSPTDCEQLTGGWFAHSIGLNPQERMPERCPSLYVPN
jgi:hypothetical protein